MSLIIQKFGGTSVGSIARMSVVVDRIVETFAQGHQVVVIVSAMAGETDRLIELAKALSDDPSPREYDMLLATGESVSAALLTIALQARGIAATALTGAQAGIFTNDTHCG